jgi:hypothetical protein
MIGLRASAELRARIERWARNQPDKLSLSEAVRRLVESALPMEKRRSGSIPVSKLNASNDI